MNKLIFILFFILACNGNKGDLQNKLKDEKKLSTNIEVGDTIVILNPLNSILVYSLSQNEYDSLNETESYEYNEGYSDMIDELKKNNYTIQNNPKILTTASNYIKIGDLIIDRHSLKSKFGYIIINNLGKINIFENGQ